LNRLPDFESLGMDQTLALNHRFYSVSDHYIAKYISVEGDLPFQAEAGTEISVADLDGDGASCATIDYSETPPIVFIGEYVDIETLKLS
jgi:hypothetical protein